MDKKIITKSKHETQELGLKFAKELKGGEVVLLYGDLGAGKTTFVQGLARGFGITERILSPTFVLQRIHKIQKRGIGELNHIDLYRIENPKDIDSLGLAEILDEGNSITVIEWADRIKNFPDRPGYKIYFKHLDVDKREILIQKI